MKNQKKIILRNSPLIEISYDNSYIHIVDFEIQENNQHFYFDKLEKLELNNEKLEIANSHNKVEMIINENKKESIKKMISEIEKIITSREIIYPKENYINESFEEFNLRYNGYGKKIFEELRKLKPEIFKKIAFYQSKEDKEDGFAEYIDEEISFAIRLDFYREEIIIWNNKWGKEIGFWENNEIEKSLNFIIEKVEKSQKLHTT